MTRVLADSYGYTPLYFTLFDENNRMTALMPLMEAKSILTGSDGVSLPLPDYCEPLCGNDADREELINTILEYAGTQGWKYVELRPEKKNTRTGGASPSYRNHRLNISPDDEKLFASCRTCTRRKIKRGLDAGADCSICTSRPSVEQFHDLDCMTIKSHGTPPPPFSFIKNAHRYIISLGCRCAKPIGLALMVSSSRRKGYASCSKKISQKYTFCPIVLPNYFL